MRRTLVASFVIVALASAGWFTSMGVGSGATAWVNGSGVPYHWARTSSSFTLKVIDSSTASFDAHLDAAITDWSASDVLNLTKEAGSSDSKTAKRCAAAGGKVRVCNAAYGNNGWLGIASIWAYSDAHIVQGTVKNNDTYFNGSSPGTGYNTPAWRQFVMCQEIGHTFGLGHDNEVFGDPNRGTCMDYTNDPDGGAGGAAPNDPSNTQPGADALNMLASIYAHTTDGFTTVASSTTASGTGKGNGAGAAIDDDPSDAVPAGASAKDGRVFVRDLGNGQRVISVVIWASDFPGANAPGRNDH